MKISTFFTYYEILQSIYNKINLLNIPCLIIDKNEKNQENNFCLFLNKLNIKQNEIVFYEDESKLLFLLFF